MKLQGKTAMMVGCSPLINGGIALGLAEEGARLVCVDIKLDLAEACAKAIRQAGGEAIAVKADVTNEDEVVAALAAANKAFGGIDILVNGAVLQVRKGIRDLSAQDFRRQIEVILVGPFLFTKHVAEAMIAQGRKGNIINILSTEAHQGNPGNIGYGTGKGGLFNFTRAAAMELAPFGIRVNSLTPTATDPAEGDRRVAEWGVDWQAPSSGKRPGFTKGDQGVPLGKRPSPSHYAKAAIFLASDDAEMITGFDLRVDGGTISRYWRWNPGLESQIG
jgi:NAD(P)-dependent dehydrogenase (short-subunit alcohol dehydrogenase family)